MKGDEIKLLVTVGFNYEDGQHETEKEKIIKGFSDMVKKSPMPLFVKLIEDNNLIDI